MRGKTTNVIELNGNLYDARTGKPVHKKTKLTSFKQPAKPSAPAKKSPRPVDGFALNKGKPAVKSTIKPKPAPAIAKSAAPKASSHKSHSKAPSMKHRAQRSTTLNRKAVKAPLVRVSSEIMPRSVKLKEDVNKRLDRAMQVSKSSFVNRFPKTTATVAEQVSKLPSRSSEPKKEEPKATLVHEKITKQTAATPTTVKEVPKKQAAKKPKRRLKKKHFSRAGGFIIGVIVLAAIGYLIYLNIPAVSMKVAASQAGFAATLPSYTPEGYHVDGPVESNGGVVTLNYQSGSDNKTFSLTEQQSTWDAEALKENYIAAQTSTEPTTQQYNGLTIYLYDGKAAWINAGTLYVLDTNGTQLGVDQILKLATST